MPLAHLHLLHLSPTLPIPTALLHLSTPTPTWPNPVTLSLAIRWIILPTLTHPSPTTTHLLSHPWTILLITLTPTLPPTIQENLLGHYHLATGIPSRLLTNYSALNTSLLHPAAESVPALTGSLDTPRLGPSAQTLELDAQLLDWARGVFGTQGGKAGKGAVSMLNLLAFKEGSEHRERYARYGRAFGEGAGSRRGGRAKLVGNVVPTAERAVGEEGQGKGMTRGRDEGDGRDGWDEFALAHYPSIEHFVDMLAGEDYQEVNLKWRVPSLRETCILCTSEVAVEEILERERKRKAEKGKGSRL